MGEEALESEVKSLIIAGFMTAEPTLCWALYYILTAPGVYEKLMQSFSECHNQPDCCLTDSEYLDLIIKETLRLRPPSSMPLRWSKEAIDVGSYRIEKDQLIFLSPFLTHQRDEIWKNPEIFQPERFIGLNTAQIPTHYYPFGGGTRHCVGSSLAILEIKVVLTTILSKYRLELISNKKNHTRSRITVLVPAKNFTIKVLETLR